MSEQIQDEEVMVSNFDVEEFYGDMGLRWYQIAARNETIEHIRNGVKRICIELPTGAGKTITISALLNSASMRDALGIEGNKLKVLFVAHKHRLLTQAEKTFAKENGVDLMVQSMMSQISEEYIKKGWDIIVLDECHHESCQSFQYHLEKLGDFVIIGLTATSDRADGSLIKFSEFVKPISREQAVEEGYLAETHLYSFVDAPE